MSVKLIALYLLPFLLTNGCIRLPAGHLCD